MNSNFDEANYGIRQIYSTIPSSQEMLEQMNIPLSIHLTPLCQSDDILLSNNPPFKCECGTFLNSLASVNYNNNSFSCTSCSKHQKLPRYIIDSLEQEEMPIELQQQVIEYRLSQNQIKQTFVFLIDTCVSQDNFESLKQVLIETAQQFDFNRNNFLFVTFNRSVFFYRKTKSGKMTHTIQVPSYMNNKQMAQILNISNTKGNMMNADLIQQQFFIDNLDDAINIIEAMDIDYWHTPSSQRPQRATGKALEMTLDLLTFAKCSSSRISLFVSGPCTIQSGQIASLQISDFIRKQVDLEDNKEAADRVKKAKEFYDSLAKRFLGIKTCLDIFAYSLNQYGLYEMQNLVRKTNGLIFLGEEFKEDHFKYNLQRYFLKDQNENLKIHSAVSMQVKMSQQLEINGVIGNCQKIEKKIKNHGGNKIGECDTDEWYIGGGDSLSTFLFFFDIQAKNKNKAFRTGQVCSVQFIIKYLHSDGIYRMRLVTVQRQFLHTNNVNEFINSIDQFTLISTYGKLASYRSMKQDSFFVRRYLDQKLIHIMRSFKQGQEIPQNLNLLPQYFYYLRKSLFVSKSSVSLDEITYYRQAMIQQNVDNVLVMIQPQIIEYSLQNEDPVPVMPDMDCMKNEVVLLADTYFNIIIWRGNNIKSWIDQEYHLQEGYEYLQNLVNLPEEDCQLIIEDRTIHPFKMYAYPGSPTERYLKSRLNPENKNLNQEHEAVASGNFVTDDASLSEFMKKLLQVINQKQN